MDRLGGHPLSLYLVLPQLRHHTAAELSARFEELLPGFTAGAAKERNESLAVSLKFSLRRLGDATRAALPDLAVFQGGCMEHGLLAITEIDPELWKAARAEMEGASLITVETLQNVTVPFLRFHPTLLPYLASQLPASRRAELEDRYWQEYYATANMLYRDDIKHPHEARAIALRELPNLRRGIDLAIAAGAVEEAVDYADSVARFLDNFGRWRERDALMGKIGKLQIASGQGVTKAEFQRLDRQGDDLLQAGRAAEAEALFRDLLRRLEAGAVYDAAYDHAIMQFSVGRCLKAQGRPGQAIEWHRRALGEFERISESSESAKKMAGAAHTDIATFLRTLGKFDDAEDEHKLALQIHRELDDLRGVGVDLGQLGNLALSRGDLAEARQRHTEALATFHGLGEPQMEAVAWHQLGIVAQEAEAWDEAERCYRESLKLEEQMNHAEGVAQTCNQLAIVAENAGRPADAERWYLRAQQIRDQVSPQDASSLNNLAGLYLAQGRLDEAGRYAHRAVKIDEAIGDPSVEIWKDYSILVEIAEAQGRPDEAAGWRRKEQESYGRTQDRLWKSKNGDRRSRQWPPGSSSGGAGDAVARIRQQWAQVVAAVVDVCRGNADAVRAVAPFLEQLAGQDDWRALAAVLRRILAGERDATLLNGLDATDRVIVGDILAALGGQGASDKDHAEGAQSGESGDGDQEPEDEPQGMTLDDLLGLVATACSPGAPAGLGEQLFGLTRGLSSDSRMPAEIRGLGRVLNAVLAGKRDPDLSALPPELADKVRAMLAGMS